MALETVVNIADLVTTNPTASDPKSQGDDHIRNIKIALANDFAGFTGAVMVTGTDGGLVNAYTLTSTNALVAYGTKMAAVFSPTITSTGASTLNISGLGAKAIKRVDGTDVTAGDLVAGSIYVAIYNGTNFILIAPTKNYIDQLSFSAALPAQSGRSILVTNGSVASWTADQTGNGGKFLTTSGSALSWDYVSLTRSPRTSNTILAAGDKSSLIDVTSGTFTQTITAAATLGSGWWCWYRNSGTGVVTLDPNASETINGYTTVALNFGQYGVLVCDGSNFQMIPLQQTGFALSTSQLDKTTDTALANIPGLSLTVDSGGKYIFEACVFTGSGSAGGGAQLAMNGTATATSYVSQTVGGSTQALAISTFGSGSGSTAAYGAIRISGVIVVNAGGTLNVQFAQNSSSATTSSAQVNSWFRLTKIS